MIRRFLPAVGACLISGCAGLTNTPPPVAPGATAEAAPPKPAPGLDWHFASDGAYGKLAYGPANSDEVHLMLSCPKGSGQVTLVRSVPTEQAGTPPKLTLVSGTAKGTWLAKAAASQLEPGRTDLTVTMPSMDPVLQAFAQRGWASVVTGDQTENLAPQPGGKAVRQFFRFCG